MTDEEAAYHEAGHAIIAMTLGYACASVSIIIKNTKGDREGSTCEDPRRTQLRTPQQRYEDRVAILVAAEIAQRTISPHGNWKASIKADQADILEAVIEHVGRDASEDAIHKERRQVVAKVRPRVERLVVQHWHQIDRLAQDLLLKKKIVFSQPLAREP